MTIYVLLIVLAFLIINDPSAMAYVALQSKRLEIVYHKMIFLVLHHPANPIVRYFIWKRSYKLAKQLQDELKSNAK